MFVLPQFSAVLRDFGAELDPVAGMFVRLSDVMVAYKEMLGGIAIILLMSGCGCIATFRVSSSAHLPRDAIADGARR